MCTYPKMGEVRKTRIGRERVLTRPLYRILLSIPSSHFLVVKQNARGGREVAVVIHLLLHISRVREGGAAPY